MHKKQELLSINSTANQFFDKSIQASPKLLYSQKKDILYSLLKKTMLFYLSKTPCLYRKSEKESRDRRED